MLRSSTPDISLDDDEAASVAVTSHRRLSRCHFEDIVVLQSGDPLVLYVKNDKTALDELFKKTDLRAVSKSQRKDKIGGGSQNSRGKNMLSSRLVSFQPDCTTTQRTDSPPSLNLRSSSNRMKASPSSFHPRPPPLPLNGGRFPSGQNPFSSLRPHEAFCGSTIYSSKIGRMSSG